MKMAKISILISLLSHLLCAMAQRQPFPCSEYFIYMTKPEKTDLLGQIEIPSPSENDTFFLKVALDTTTGWPSQVARLELAKSIQKSLENVHWGRPLLYHVYYHLTYEPIPSVSAIWFNDKRYCPSSEVSVNITATIELGHILYSSSEEPRLYSYGPWQLNSLPWHRNSSTYRIDNPSYDRLNYKSQLNNECGITSYYTDETNRLIPDGEKTLPGQWPWLVAIYIQPIDNESAYNFECAGSLLTARHVVTAKRCIVMWNNYISVYTLIEPQRVYVSFGQFNSSKWHGNYTEVINRMIVDYKMSSNDMSETDNLAVLILKRDIEYNAFIKPICLWSGSTNLEDVVNMTGYIAGWGYKNSEYPSYGSYTEEPRMVKVPLMNLSKRPGDEILEVLRAPAERLNYDRTCDLGGGLVFFNITTGRYQLRGVAIDCYPGRLNTLYIDVANHLPWIREQISIK